MTVDLYILEQKEPAQSLLDYVHHLVLHLAPDCYYSVKWGRPVYKIQKDFLYLSPLGKGGKAIEICFPRGRSFEYGIECLDFKDRKVVGGLTYSTLEEVDEDLLQGLLLEAIRVDEKYKGSTPWKVG